MNHLPSNSELNRLDSLIGELDRAGDKDLLYEHLRSARIYLLGAMPEEYALSLDFAREAAHEVRNPVLRHKMDEEIGSLIGGRK
jgi:hypothetical protein